MLELLIDCHDVGSKQSDLQKGINIFENYCKKVDKNLANTSRFIDHVQKGFDFI